MLGEQVTRQWKILQRIQRSPGVSIRELSQDFQVTERTIRRDLSALFDPFPIYSSRRWDGQKGWFFVEGYRFPQLHFTEAEMMSLLTCREFLPESARSAYGAVLEDAFEKIESVLTEEVKSYLDRLKDGLSQKSIPDSGNGASKLTVLQQSIGDRKSVEITYHSFRSEKTEQRRVDPYHVRYVDGSLYLIGYCHLREQVRTFTIDGRMQEVQVTEEGFEMSEDFSIDRFLEGSFGIFQGKKQKVVIRFDPGAARYVRNKVWHPSQQIEELPDGSVLEKLTVTGLQDVEKWVFSFGSQAEVIEPAELREKFRKEVGQLAEKYGRSDTICPGDVVVSQ